MNKCIKNHWYLPNTFFTEYDNSAKQTYIILTYKCIQCEDIRFEQLMPLADMTLAEIEVVAKQCISEGFSDTRAPL